VGPNDAEPTTNAADASPVAEALTKSTGTTPMMPLMTVKTDLQPDQPEPTQLNGIIIERQRT